MSFKGQCLFIEDAKLCSKVADPNATSFTSPNPFKPLRFTNNSSILGNNIDSSEERDFHVDFKRTVKNSLQNSKKKLNEGLRL